MGGAGIALLGPLSVNGGDVSLSRRDRIVLTALAVHPGDVVSAHRLADALWGDDPPASWDKVVPGCVMRLRRALGAGVIETTAHGYRLTVRCEEIDAHRFEREVQRGRELLTIGEADRAAYVLSGALALWRGRALDELADWGPGRIESCRLEELRLDAEEARLDAWVQSGRYPEVLAEAQARVAEAPLRERRWALLALAQYRAGRQGEALRTLRQARTVLATELGLDPGPELVALEQRVLRQDPGLISGDGRAVAGGACPYQGLVSYDVADADGFFGRDVDVAECLRLLARTHAVVVVGASGSGKSSLLRAGVAAALRRAGREVVVITPGAHPSDALAAAPVAADTLLVVDQCEEAVTLCADPLERSRFLAALSERRDVAVAVRADRLGEMSASPAFARLVQQSFFLLGAMGADDLRAAVEGPAHQAGLLLEPGLVDLLIGEVEGEPGALPLLSHALRQTWERREGRVLTVAGYRATGSIRGAVAQSAEELWEQIPPEQRPILQDVVLRLVAASPDGEPIRCRVARRTVALDAHHDALIEQLVAARLVTSDDEFVELAHEALARAWPRLRGWLDDDVEGQRIFRHLVGAAETWDAMGRPDSELYRGVRLSHALAWQRASHTPEERELLHADLTPTERDFLTASEREATSQRRSQQRRATLLGAVAVLLVLAVLAGLVAVRQRERADTASLAAEARAIAGIARDTDEVDRALLLAVEAVDLDDSSHTRSSLLAAISRSPALVGMTRSEIAVLGPDAGPALDVSPDGSVVATADGLAATSFHDASTLRTVGWFHKPPYRLEYRPDGRQLAIATSAFVSYGDREFDATPLHLLDGATFQEEPVQLGGLPDGDAEAWDVAYSGDSRLLAAALHVYPDGWEPTTAPDPDTAVLVWDVTAPELPLLRVDHEAVYEVALSADGRLLYVVSYADTGELVVYDVATGDQVGVRTLAELPWPLFDGLATSPRDSVLAVQDVDNEVALLDATTLEERARLRGHTAMIRTLQFSPDGTQLASGSDDRSVVVWDVATATLRERLSGHSGSVRGVDFGPDGGTVYSVSAERELLVWDVDGGRRFIPRTTASPVGAFPDLPIPAPDGELVAFLGWGWSRQLWGIVQFLDVATGDVGEARESGHANWGPAWRPPDHEQFATTDGSGFVYVWDPRHGTLLAERKVSDGNGEIAYTRDGERLLVFDVSGTVFQVDADTLEPVGRRVRVGSQRGSVAPGADDRLAVAVTGRSSAAYTLVDLVDGRIVDTADLGVEIGWLEVSPDGRRLAVGTVAGEVGLVDLDTGQWVRPPTVGHTGMVLRLSYAPDGLTFATSGHDGRVSLWDGHTGDLIGTVLPGRPNEWATVEFLPDGHTLIIASRDGQVFTWDTRLEHWVEFACAVAGRNLTDGEWRAAFGDRPYRETCPPR